MAATENNKLQSNRSLIKTKDSAGNEIAGVMRTPGGGLLVLDKEGYDQVVREREQTKTINTLVNELDDLKTMVKQLLETQQNE